MEPKIVTKEAFTVVGLPFMGLLSGGPFEDGENNNEIGHLWDELNARAAEIPDQTGPAIGLCFAPPNANEPWYLAGLEVAGAAPVPPGMMSKTVPAQKWAAFECTLPTIGETYRYIAEEWQPRSGYTRAWAPDFELYGADWDMADMQHSKMYIYWPIQ